MLHVTSRIYTQTKPRFPISNQSILFQAQRFFFLNETPLCNIIPPFIYSSPFQSQNQTLPPIISIKVKFQKLHIYKSNYLFYIKLYLFHIKSHSFYIKRHFSISNSTRFFLHQTPLYFFYNQIKWVNFSFLILLVYMQLCLIA